MSFILQSNSVRRPSSLLRPALALVVAWTAGASAGHAQPAAVSPDSAGVYGLADTPDHPILLQKKGRPPEEAIARFPARVLKATMQGLAYITGRPLSAVVDPTVIREVQDVAAWLRGSPFYLADGSQGDGSGVGIEFGIEARTGPARPFRVTLSTAWTYRLYQTHALRVRQALHPLMDLQAWGQYRSRPKENFFGVGPGTSEASRSVFKQSNLNAGAGFSVHPDRLRLSWTAEVTDYTIDDGRGEKLPSTLTRFPDMEGSAGARLYSAGFYVTYPALPYRQPIRDTAVEASVEVYWDADGSRFGFNRYTLLVYQTLPLFWGDRVLAVRAQGAIADQRGQKKIPFFLLNHLGGASTLRGYENHRFWDKKSFMVNAEYRYPLWDIGINRGYNKGMAVDIVLFLDTGLAFDSFDQDFKAENFSTDYGGGFRLRADDGVRGRVLLARSPEAMQVVVKLAKDF